MEKAQKYFRPLLMALGLSYVAYNIVLNTDNPNSWISRTLNPKGKAKYTLKVERLDDQIAAYK